MGGSLPPERRCLRGQSVGLFAEQSFTQCYSRLADDGWFYEGIVARQLGHGTVLVQDEDSELETYEISELLPRAPLLRADAGVEVRAHAFRSEQVQILRISRFFVSIHGTNAAMLLQFWVPLFRASVS